MVEVNLTTNSAVLLPDVEPACCGPLMELIVPPRVSAESAARVQELAVAAFVASDCEGMARVDFFVRPGGDVVVNELNTIPGFTSTSVYSKLFAASGTSYPDLLDRLVELALERHERRARLRY